MLFSSMIFIGIFLPITSIGYLFCPKKLHNLFLLLASFFFYGWGTPTYLTIIFTTILINYFGALYISETENTTERKILLVFTILLNLGYLFYFKYFNFFAQNLNTLFHTQLTYLKILMPLGISFYTFQALSYVIDVYRKEVLVQHNFCKLALYISLFPQLIAGPIVKYHNIAEQIDNRTADLNKICYGIKRFIIGLSKKMLLANTLGTIVDMIFTQPVKNFDCLTAWLGAIAYSLQLFYDFSGYSDMAIGLGAIFGFKFLENFNYPYISKSITEFWRRWHISLSTWFKEYLYIPLGGNRVSKLRNYFNLFIVFLATGFWHGANWNFIVWGLWYGFFIILEKITGWYKKEGNLLLRILQHIYTILVFIIGWVIFRADSMNYAIQYIQNMFGLVNNHQIIYKFSYYIDNAKIIAIFLALLCSMPIFKNILNVSPQHKICYALINLWLILLFIISVSEITNSTYNPFIYFRF